jgi:hypothetical protein
VEDVTFGNHVTAGAAVEEGTGSA